MTNLEYLLTILCTCGCLDKSQVHLEKLDPERQDADQLLIAVTGKKKAEILETIDKSKGFPDYFRSVAEKCCDAPMELMSGLSDPHWTRQK